MTAARIRRLTLNNFRSYRAQQLAITQRLVVLTGPNGAGKTNLIEAISYLSPGRGLRRATLSEAAFTEGDGSWAVSVQLEGALGLATLGTGIEPPGTMPTETRKCRIDGEAVGSAAAFTDHLSVIWLTPTMDQLFMGPASERRRFLDRFALAIDASHNARVSALERSLRARNRLLEDPRPDQKWLDAAEHETAELAVAVAAGRSETVRQLSAALARRHDDSHFPAARIALEGALEAGISSRPAAEIEDDYRAVLKANRARDAAAGRTLEGPHLSDLKVFYAAKGIAASDGSTGEQKALLIGLILAHAQLIADMTGQAPILLLDEVVAHLDPSRRRALYDQLDRLGAQVWMTGADPAAFADVSARADVIDVSPGRAQRAA
ncbi:DNA replication and repair protein RecF [Variibacter gotjawalensis]|uniref:DNA replication and repair protein RecF n=1 Tax=Variibacter gotjawalensis TaxID=1333996 RepID=A0A0S3PPS0_9BRAD|nr:DNA replication/repair protein RecF [Variibacter gotjawalensis]NIK48055.1 DNA replication and repair protein RecF [Variibacter gotjawalensis]RZS49931.1 DNA replication and repair protein RecF [Variibacter gotjawalensis]BAT57758.1 DNA replication and repair protein RecF [Variibacter gotjawalensis]